MEKRLSIWELGVLEGVGGKGFGGSGRRKRKGERTVIVFKLKSKKSIERKGM